MKNKVALLFVAANLVAIVIFVFLYPHVMISPGNPIDAHAKLAKDCFSCHTPFLGSSPEKCINCHAVNDIGKKTTKGLPILAEQRKVAFHQTLVQKDCISCHSDHKGVKAFRPISQFSHNLLEPDLQQQCSSCHLSPTDELHRQVKNSCTQCHTQEAWKPAAFDHDKYFRFDRDHNTECETCHVENNYANYTCYGCHEHSRSKVREEHYEEGIRDYAVCVECHRSGDEDEAERI